MKKNYDLVELRRRHGLSQSKFWSKVGVTQSGGSRFENGRRPPRSVEILLDLIYVRNIELAKLKQIDQSIVGHVEKNYPDLYKSLLKDFNRKNNEAAT